MTDSVSMRFCAQGSPSQHWRVMNRLISSGDEKIIDARSPKDTTGEADKQNNSPTASGAYFMTLAPVAQICVSPLNLA
jgi:hypothetical protein